MAELVGTTIGVVGVLGQLFDGCLKAYGYFTTAQNFDTESQRLLCKVRIEEMRLVVWGREWGVAEGRLEAHLDSTSQSGNPQLRALATQILQQLHGTVTDFRKLKETYGLDDNGAAASRPPHHHAAKAAGLSTTTSSSSSSSSGDPPAMEKPGRSPGAVKSQRSWRKDLSLKTKWVITDKEKFSNLLSHLKDFNDGLERLFPPSQLPSFQRAWTHQLLDSAQRDLNQLSLLEKASTGIYPRLTNTASLKRLRINLDAKPQSAFKPTHALRVPRDSLTITSEPPAGAPAGGAGGPAAAAAAGKPNGVGKRRPRGSSSISPSASSSSVPATATVACAGAEGGGGAVDDGTTVHRCHAHHDPAGDVVVEWVEYDREALDERVAHLRRLDDLARMMQLASERHPDLHSIDCLGYTDDSDHSRYGLVYRAPAPSFSSLHALISSPDLRTPDLDARVGLASALAVATWSLHSLDWLHKSLCASNVLFFPSAFAASAHGATASAALVPDISDPYLVGFDASRPDLDSTLSVAPRNPSIADLHRHPSSLRGLPYSKAFDVYSLGLVLLEIGLWKVLHHYHKPHYSAERWRDRVVLPVLVPGLGSKTGRRYREVVEMCISVDEGLSGPEVGKLMENVVGKLESIRL